MAEGAATAAAVGAFLATIDAVGSATGTSTASAVSVPPVVEGEPQGGGAGWPTEEEDRPRVKSTRERIRDILEEVDEAAEEMLEAVSGEVIGTVAPRPVDVAAIADRMTPRLASEEADDDDLLLLSF